LNFPINRLAPVVSTRIAVGVAREFAAFDPDILLGIKNSFRKSLEYGPLPVNYQHMRHDVNLISPLHLKKNDFLELMSV
jgi:hypothetical protein